MSIEDSVEGLRVELTPVADYPALKNDWTSLEARSADCSFFNTWAWTGTWLETIPPSNRPLVCRVRDSGDTVAVAILGQRRRVRFGVPFRQVLLNVSGDALHDRIHLEMNRLLSAPGQETSCAKALFRALLCGQQVACDEFLLPGLSHGDRYERLATSEGLPTRSTHKPAPYVDFVVLRRAGETYINGLSKKVRYAIRRALTDYSKALGPPQLSRAGSIEEARDYLARLALLHQQRWTAKGRKGAFAGEPFRNFHNALVGKAFPNGHIDLFCVRCADKTVGFVYVFRYRDVAAFYQCGFDYTLLPDHNQPGYLALPLVIAHYADTDTKSFEFLGGEEHYKRRLATDCRVLSSLEIHPRGISRSMMLRQYRRWKSR